MSRWLKGLESSFIACRDTRHHWETDIFRHIPTNDHEKWGLRSLPFGVKQVIARVLKCRRCGTLKFEFMARTVDQISALRPFTKFKVRYVYPPAYRWKPSAGEGERPKHADYVQEQWRRWKSG